MAHYVCGTTYSSSGAIALCLFSAHTPCVNRGTCNIAGYCCQESTQHGGIKTEGMQLLLHFSDRGENRLWGCYLFPSGSPRFLVYSSPIRAFENIQGRKIVSGVF